MKEMTAEKQKEMDEAMTHRHSENLHELMNALEVVRAHPETCSWALSTQIEVAAHTMKSVNTDITNAILVDLKESIELFAQALAQNAGE